MKPAIDYAAYWHAKSREHITLLRERIADGDADLAEYAIHLIENDITAIVRHYELVLSEVNAHRSAFEALSPSQPQSLMPLSHRGVTL